MKSKETHVAAFLACKCSRGGRRRELPYRLLHRWDRVAKSDIRLTYLPFKAAWAKPVRGRDANILFSFGRGEKAGITELATLILRPEASRVRRIAYRADQEQMLNYLYKYKI